MRLPSIFVPLTLCAALAGCVDGLDAPPVPETPECVPPATRAGQSAVISGEIVDQVTGEPIAADVAFNTAWDVVDAFPGECEPLATFTTSDDGRFGPRTIDVGSTEYPPIALFMITGDDLADTASDQTLTCDGADCDDLDHAMAVPERDLAGGWRRELERGGMPGASSRGLVLFRFNEADGSPAAGVVPQTLTAEPVLVPGVQVRFLEDDRATLAPPDTAETTASGMAIIGIDEELVSGYIFGARGDDSWDSVDVLSPPGWIFLEDERPVPRQPPP